MSSPPSNNKKRKAVPVNEEEEEEEEEAPAAAAAAAAAPPLSGICMNCLNIYNLEEGPEQRLPMAPCRGCGYQICLQCVRDQQLADASYRMNQVLAKNVECPNCKEKRSFNAEEPVLNQLAIFYMRELESTRKEKKEKK